jgi:hypothetical protein
MFKLLQQRKQAKFQWLQDPSQKKKEEDYLIIGSCEGGRHFKNQERERVSERQI